MSVWNVVIGCVTASFVNAAVIRAQKNQDYVFSRSCCPVCGHLLSFVDMLPVIGYLIRKGKCHYCGCKISIRYPVMEIIGGVRVLLSRNVYDFVLYMILLAVSLYDSDTMTIRNRYLIMLTVLSCFLVDLNYINDHLLGSVIVSVPMCLIAITTKGFGFGDVKLMAVCGFLLGWERAIRSFVLGCMTGSVYALSLLIRKKAGMNSEIPFGPFLAMGIRISWRYGFRLIDFYEFLFIRVYN